MAAAQVEQFVIHTHRGPPGPGGGGGAGVYTVPMPCRGDGKRQAHVAAGRSASGGSQGRHAAAGRSASGGSQGRHGTSTKRQGGTSAGSPIRGLEPEGPTATLKRDVDSSDVRLRQENEELRLQVEALREEQRYATELHSQVIASIVRERNELEEQLLQEQRRHFQHSQHLGGQQQWQQRQHTPRRDMSDAEAAALAEESAPGTATSSSSTSTSGASATTVPPPPSVAAAVAAALPVAVAAARAAGLGLPNSAPQESDLQQEPEPGEQKYREQQLPHQEDAYQQGDQILQQGNQQHDEQQHYHQHHQQLLQQHLQLHLNQPSQLSPRLASTVTSPTHGSSSATIVVPPLSLERLSPVRGGRDTARSKPRESLNPRAECWEMHSALRRALQHEATSTGLAGRRSQHQQQMISELHGASCAAPPPSPATAAASTRSSLTSRRHELGVDSHGDGPTFSFAAPAPPRVAGRSPLHGMSGPPSRNTLGGGEGAVSSAAPAPPRVVGGSPLHGVSGPPSRNTLGGGEGAVALGLRVAASAAAQASSPPRPLASPSAPATGSSQASSSLAPHAALTSPLAAPCVVRRPPRVPGLPTASVAQWARSHGHLSGVGSPPLSANSASFPSGGCTSPPQTPASRCAAVPSPGRSVAAGDAKAGCERSGASTPVAGAVSRNTSPPPPPLRRVIIPSSSEPSLVAMPTVAAPLQQRQQLFVRHGSSASLVPPLAAAATAAFAQRGPLRTVGQGGASSSGNALALPQNVAVAPNGQAVDLGHPAPARMSSAASFEPPIRACATSPPMRHGSFVPAPPVAAPEEPAFGWPLCVDGRASSRPRCGMLLEMPKVGGLNSNARHFYGGA